MCDLGLVAWSRAAAAYSGQVSVPRLRAAVCHCAGSTAAASRTVSTTCTSRPSREASSLSTVTGPCRLRNSCDSTVPRPSNDRAMSTSPAQAPLTDRRCALPRAVKFTTSCTGALRLGATRTPASRRVPALAARTPWRYDVPVFIAPMWR